ncbi:MAG: FAD-dependent monooxygenase [Dermatophilaceae bacterium]
MAAQGRRPRATSVAVVGGGIGGLTAALSLLDAGFDVHVFEQAPALAEVGAALQVTPNACRVLDGLGLSERLARAGSRSLAWRHRRWHDGRTLLLTPLGDEVVARFAFPHYQLRRADLLRVLLHRLPPDRLHVGHRVAGFQQNADRVRVTFVDGRSVEADLLVGADGIHSVVRTQLFGPQAPHFTGCAAVRALVPVQRLGELSLEATSQVWMGPGRHLVHYFVSAGTLLNVVAVIDHDSWTRESWNDRGDPGAALAAFEGWHPQVRRILEAVDDVYVWALLDRAPMPRWSSGRVTLLGDACHAMLPFKAQNAAQAIEDAATLTASLADERSDLGSALQRYERLRIPRTSRIQALSTQNKTRFHLPDGPQQRQRDAEMAAGTTDWSEAAVAWIYDHDARSLDPGTSPPPS